MPPSSAVPGREGKSKRAAAGHPTSRLVAVAAVAFVVPVAALMPLWRADAAAAAPGAARTGGDAPNRELVAEVERLRAERDIWTDAQRRAAGAAPRPEAAPAALAADGENAVAPAAGTSEAVDALLGDLMAQLRGGGLRGRFEQQPYELVRFVLGNWLACGQPQAALALLRRLPPELVDTEIVAQVGQALKAAGDVAGAREALLSGLRQDGFDWGVVTMLADVDPVAGLARLREIAALDPAGPGPGFHTAELDLLLAAGRTDEAKALLRTVGREPGAWGDGDVPPWLEVLVNRAPALALEMLDHGPPQGIGNVEAAILRARSQRAVGDGAAAQATLTGVVREHPDADYAWNMLAEIDAAAALHMLESLGSAAASPGLSVRRADLLLRTGRTDEAAGILLGIAESNWELARDALLRASPDIAVAKARQHRDDELLGDAADQAWQAGRQQQAIDLWREAQQIDPGDGEWREKLRAALTGGQPLGGN